MTGVQTCALPISTKAELEKARGNLVHPVYKEGVFGGASHGIKNIAEYVAGMK